MPTMSNADLLTYHDSKVTEYARLAQLVAQFLAWRVQSHFEEKSKFPVLHLHSHRAKSSRSLKHNLENGRYAEVSLEKITDLAGARLIFYFKDDLDDFVKVRSNDFEGWFGTASREVRNVQGSKLADGTRRTGPGYQSYHFIVRVTSDTSFYKALRREDQHLLAGLYCEVQLRTILKHAWAEAEHDLRYKIENLLKMSLPDARTDELFNSAAMIDAGEALLSQCKQELTLWIGKAKDPKRPNVAAARPQSAAEPGAYVHAGVHYPYILLDDGASGLPQIHERADIFSVDQTIEKLLQVRNYKESMWKLLQLEEPQFIASVSHDSLVVRVCGWDPGSRTLSVQPAYYSDQVVTNHKQVLNKKVPGVAPARTPRALSRDGADQLLAFEDSPMSNTLGVSCVIRVEGRHWVIAHRSSSLAFDPGLVGCPASGALEWTELGYWVGRDFVSWCAGGMARELEEEIGYKASPQDFVYLGFARELSRAGKPQIFFLLDLDVSFLSLRALWTTYTAPNLSTLSSRSEYSAVRSISDAEALLIVGGDAQATQAVTQGVVANEELRMNLALALRRKQLV